MSRKLTQEEIQIITNQLVAPLPPSELFKGMDSAEFARRYLHNSTSDDFLDATRYALMAGRQLGKSSLRGAVARAIYMDEVDHVTNQQTGGFPEVDNFHRHQLGPEVVYTCKLCDAVRKFSGLEAGLVGAELFDHICTPSTKLIETLVKNAMAPRPDTWGAPTPPCSARLNIEKLTDFLITKQRDGWFCAINYDDGQKGGTMKVKARMDFHKEKALVAFQARFSIKNNSFHITSTTIEQTGVPSVARKHSKKSART